MEKYKVEDIERRATEMRNTVKGQRAESGLNKPIILVRQLRFYCDQVLFLCKEVKRLKKKLEK